MASLLQVVPSFSSSSYDRVGWRIIGTRVLRVFCENIFDGDEAAVILTAVSRVITSDHFSCFTRLEIKCPRDGWCRLWHARLS